MREINPNLYPPDGYIFIDRNGFRHRGDSWRDLSRRVQQYREINRFPVGDVWSEIMSQSCERNPNFCHEVTHVPPPAPRESLSFNQRVIEWFVKLVALVRLNRLPRVDDQEASRRARICSQCPHQQDFYRGCTNCLRIIETSRKVILNGATSLHPGLKPCSVLGEDCSISVHIQQPRIVSEALPHHCWRKGQ